MGDAWLDCQKHLCPFMPSCLLLLFHHSTGISQWLSVFEIRPCWQSDHEMICHSAVARRCRLRCGWSTKVSLFLQSPATSDFTFSSFRCWWLSGPSALESYHNLAPFSHPVAHRVTHGHNMEANMISSLPPQLQFQEVKAEHCQPITAKDIQLIKS